MMTKQQAEQFEEMQTEVHGDYRPTPIVPWTGRR